MLESDHEVENESSPTKSEVDQVADDLQEKIVIDPLDPGAQDVDSTDSSGKTSMKDRAKAGAQKAAKVVRDKTKQTYIKVKEKNKRVQERAWRTHVTGGGCHKTRSFWCCCSHHGCDAEFQRSMEKNA
jgi:hypothetical protein